MFRGSKESNSKKMRFQLGLHPDGKWMSLRFFKVKVDALITKEGIRFVQFGSPVKFIMWVPKGVGTPRFMLDHKWHVRYTTKRLRIGYTYAPINFAKYWRVNENRKAKRAVRPTALLT